ncbi:hypothetical protein VFPPC_17853 [Pochonia chlamydosporia 170]|uniref:Uncharacterized protein n=1 Tax=Pochonia chlamydosporia 170 TaxID=1380566 RepID=A0A219ARJ4_METCM|nr:hypothetical protein VFPPC_17853 [Pochonia chlamydosporia 170]OWT42954.1 hypothetical protein VFPPC_17853 [Pochonia chlamydosporia 170]
MEQSQCYPGLNKLCFSQSCSKSQGGRQDASLKRNRDSSAVNGRPTFCYLRQEILEEKKDWRQGFQSTRRYVSSRLGLQKSSYWATIACSTGSTGHANLVVNPKSFPI